MFYFISSLAQKRSPRKPQIHDFDQACAQSYVFEPASESTQNPKFYMTGWKKGIQRYDQIVLRQNDQTCFYTVEEIEYYSELPHLWIALLTPSAP